VNSTPIRLTPRGKAAATAAAFLTAAAIGLTWPATDDTALIACTRTARTSADVTAAVAACHTP
jgi:hypothetical protein